MIGRGAHSTVYRARYGPVQQVVAVKVFAEGVCSRDAYPSSGRRHPARRVVGRRPVPGCRPHPAGSLAARLADQPASPPAPSQARVTEAIRLVEQLAAIVSYLHRQGVVHGNLKPSNVLLAADDIPRLTDLRPASGLCHAAPPLDDAEPAALGYLAPELVRDPAAEPRPYTDVYGLGLILYELLTGRPPFTASTAREVLEQVRSSDPLPPSHLNAEATPALDACCLRCLSKDPWRRYSRVYDLFTRLGYLRREREEMKRR